MVTATCPETVGHLVKHRFVAMITLVFAELLDMEWDSRARPNWLGGGSPSASSMTRSTCTVRLAPIGDVPSAESEMAYYRQQQESVMAAWLNQKSLRKSRVDSIVTIPKSQHWLLSPYELRPCNSDDPREHHGPALSWFANDLADDHASDIKEGIVGCPPKSR